MHETKTISVTDALEQLKYPSFFESNERVIAYEIVLDLGSEEERETAEFLKTKYPFSKNEDVFSLKDDDNFPIASTALSA